GRSQRNVTQPSTGIKLKAGMGKTLVIVCSEPYAILISPTSVERQRANVQATATGHFPFRTPTVGNSAPIEPAGPVIMPRSTSLPATSAVAANPAAELPVGPGHAAPPNNLRRATPPIRTRAIPMQQPTGQTVPSPPVRAVGPS